MTVEEAVYVTLFGRGAPRFDEDRQFFADGRAFMRCIVYRHMNCNMAGLTVITHMIPVIAAFLQDFPALPPLPDGVACYYCLPSLPPPLLAAVACYRCLPSLLTFAYRCLILKRVLR